MGIFDRLFRRNKNSQSDREGADSGGRLFEADLKKNFGLVRTGTGWMYEGVAVDDKSSANELHEPKDYLEFLRQLTQTFNVDEVCIVLGRRTIIVANDKKPFCLVTNLLPQEVAPMVAALLRGGIKLVREYEGVIRLRLR